MGERAKIKVKTPGSKGKLSFSKTKKRVFPKTKSSPAGQILHLQRTLGNQEVQRLINSGTIQARLKIGQPNDKYEQEADRVADKVMSMPEPKLSSVNSHSSSVQRQSTCPECPEKEGIQTKPLADQITPLVQRQADEEEEPVQGKLLQRQEAEEEEEPVQTKLLQRQEGEEEEEPVQTKLQRQPEEEEEEPVQAKQAPNQAPAVTSNIESGVNSLKGGGQPLPDSTRSYFEPRFGADFSQVRVHTDSKAADTAKSINAKAFTKGKDVVFGSGQYSPGTSSGKHLLAHELTHVVQQGNGTKEMPHSPKGVQSKIDTENNLNSPFLAGDPNLKIVYEGKALLREGSKGSSVKKVQILLMKLGYDLPKKGADGIFGVETNAAIKAFQSDNGAVSDGIVGPTTIGLLDKAEVAQPVEKSEYETPKVDDVCEVLGESHLDIGIDVDYAIEQNKIYNRLLGFKDRIEWPEPIGSAAFACRVARFQKENDLEVDGMMGPNTWRIRGAELGIDTDAEQARWSIKRGGKTHTWTIDREGFVKKGVEKVRALLSEVGVHPSRETQLIKLAKQRFEVLRNEYTATNITKITVTVVINIQSGASSVDINITSTFTEADERKAAMEDFAEKHGISISQVIWVEGKGPDFGWELVSDVMHVRDTPIEWTKERIWEELVKGTKFIVYGLKEMRNTQWYRKRWDYYFNLVAVNAILGVVPQDMPLNTPIGKIADMILDSGQKVNVDKPTMEMYLRKTKRLADRDAIYELILQQRPQAKN